MENSINIWFMRQAGRYLPEYREIRKKKKNFIELCLSPKLAADISLQPIERFNFDFIILFSDILVIPYALGQPVRFQEKVGPILGELNFDPLDIDINKKLEKLTPIYETIKKIKKSKKGKKLIGFCGGPFTVLNYMIEKGTSKSHSKIKKFIKLEKKKAQQLIDLITDTSIHYLKEQIRNGADYVKIFDSWAGLLDGNDYQRFIIEPNRKISKAINKFSPETKQIFFPRGSSKNYLEFLKKVEPKILALDKNYPSIIHTIAKEKNITLQGNLDPQTLLAGGEKLIAETKDVLEKFKQNKHIFNLSHGVLPQTPIENVKLVVDIVRKYNDTIKSC